MSRMRPRQRGVGVPDGPFGVFHSTVFRPVSVAGVVLFRSTHNDRHDHSLSILRLNFLFDHFIILMTHRDTEILHIHTYKPGIGFIPDRGPSQPDASGHCGREYIPAARRLPPILAANVIFYYYYLLIVSNIWDDGLKATGFALLSGYLHMHKCTINIDYMYYK